ncbi:hypothetical protein QYE76_062337 [Lolium multiflorum]|uniref:Transposase (putative) gypsy type domain-containing protein n=1 Tax=Lolium multiflorum TaxID=4521 RepID=A0AAD8S5I4_LOLMU|nr:hypothetical protein QYE76_062337 [Lolium multiflorum]
MDTSGTYHTWRPATRTVAGREAKRVGPAVFGPISLSFISSTVPSSSSSSHSPTFAHSAPRSALLAVLRLPLPPEFLRPVNLRRASAGPRRAESFCASSSSALHSCLFLTFTASPSAELVGDRDFYKLQPHHLPGNSIFYLSCYTTFMEAYIGIRPTRETFARFFALRINSVQGVDIPAPKPPVQCGSCIISSRQGSPFFKFSGLESCRLWQGTFFYVKNNGAADLIDLPPFDPAPPAKTNWSYNPKESHNETNRIIRFMKQKMKDTGICSDDIVRTLSRAGCFL